MRGATPLAVVEEIRQQKRFNRFITGLILTLGILVISIEPLIELIL